MLHYGVTSAVMEGAYLLWWIRFARINHGFPDEDFKRMARHLGPISDTFRRLARMIEDDGPMPEMQRMAEKIEALRDLAADNYALRIEYARVTGDRPAGAGLLTRSRRRIEEDLARAGMVKGGPIEP
jgi:hypothetical protein